MLKVMLTHDDLRRKILRLDGRGYKAYKALRGAYAFPRFILYLDHIQGDPFAAPTAARVIIPQREAGFPVALVTHPARQVGLAHYLAERFAAAARRVSRPRGTGHSGQIRILPVGQQMLRRTALRVDADAVEARFTVGLPAAGRRILAHEAVELLLHDLPRVVAESLFYAAVDPAAAQAYAYTAEDAEALRAMLEARGWVAFLAEGSLLPRRSGVDDRPLESGVPLTAPPTLRAEVTLPHAGRVAGLIIPQGVTLIVGGGFHGKSTLLRALEYGIYNHKPGDGRERVVSHPATVKIRAEDGRYVAGVDISGFINHLPGGRPTDFFHTENASGSTSQAAAIMEALELGARVLLIDEDTAATNFMIRDRRMQALVRKDKEPITPFIDRVRELYTERGVSTVLVIGGSGDYLDVADTVIWMDEYRPRDATEEARAVAARFPTGRVREAQGPLPHPRRVPLPGSVQAAKGRKPAVVKAPSRKALQLGRHTVDLAAVTQLVEAAQVRAIGWALVYAHERYMDGRRTLAQVAAALQADLEAGGLDILARHGYPPNDLAEFRPLEWAAAFNRLRTARVARPEDTTG